MNTTFTHLGLPEPLIRVLASGGIVEPFPVQAATIPDVFSGKDVSAEAPTGSGKTLAFGLPLLAMVDRAGGNRPRALILAPTRELAEQIKQELNPLAKAAARRVLAVYGGVGYGPQKGALRKGVDVLVATPGRLEDLIRQGALQLDKADMVVVDEADRMADMGFLPAVRRILDGTSPQRQTLLFSATLDGDVAALSRDYQKDPICRRAGTVEPKTVDARHHFWLVERNERVRHTADVVEKAGRCIVFTRTRHGADRLTRQLSALGIGAVALHGGRSQRQRNQALQTFSSGRVQALIATDVAARGLHIDAVASVVHFDPPAGHKDYLHRSGRTARAGAAGTVVSMVTADQRRAVRRIQHDLHLRAPIGSPRLDELGRGGHRIGAPAADETRRSHASTPPAPASDGRPRHRNTSGDSVYVANLPWAATAAEVEALFARYGNVHQATVITDRRTGRSKGFGFVDMPRSAARTAIEELHGSTLGGRDLTVRFARPRRRR